MPTAPTKAAAKPAAAAPPAAPVAVETEPEVAEVEVDSSVEDAATVAVDTDTDDDDVTDDDFADLTDDDLESIIENYGLEFELEDRPKQSGRAGRPKTKPVPWEIVLTQLKTEFAGQDMRIMKPFTGDKAEAKARNRAREVRVRLFSATPKDLWSISHRRDPSNGEWKVYAKYERELTDAEANDRINKRQEIARRMAEGRQAAAATAE